MSLNRFLVVMLLCTIPNLAWATPVTLFAERDVPLANGSDFFLQSYPSVADLLAGTNRTSQGVSNPVVSSFNISGMAFDGAAVFLLAERNVPLANGSDFFLLSYPSVADLLAGTNKTSQGISNPVVSSFSISGMAFTGEPAPVPEPSSLVMLLCASTMAAFRWRRLKAASIRD